MDAVPQFPAPELPLRTQFDAYEHNERDDNCIDDILRDCIRRSGADEETREGLHAQFALHGA